MWIILVEKLPRILLRKTCIGETWNVYGDLGLKKFDGPPNTYWNQLIMGLLRILFRRMFLFCIVLLILFSVWKKIKFSTLFHFISTLKCGFFYLRVVRGKNTLKPHKKDKQWRSCSFIQNHKVLFTSKDRVKKC